MKNLLKLDQIQIVPYLRLLIALLCLPWSKSASADRVQTICSLLEEGREEEEEGGGVECCREEQTG